ncbi:hypothetical protein C8R42DRAFT_686919 [Lentinula raphanica]|nr:hypothetical protein C8R42DRAFT_686919 [Lentinula raphanica]
MAKNFIQQGWGRLVSLFQRQCMRITLCSRVFFPRLFFSSANELCPDLIKGGVKSEVQGKDHSESGKNSQAQTQCVPEPNKAESDARERDSVDHHRHPSQSSSADEDWVIVGGDPPKSGKPEGRS